MPGKRVSRGTASPLARRADARRNRAHIIEVALEAFAREGLGVPVAEIARRAGLGTGTVSRHFPTKQDLFAAIVLDRVERLVDTAHTLAEEQPPGPAFYDFIEVMALEGARNRALGEALVGAGFDVRAAAEDANQDLIGAWQALLAAAQATGDVRGDIGIDDVKHLVMSCCTPAITDDPNQLATRRRLSVIAAGLRPRTAEGSPIG